MDLQIAPLDRLRPVPLMREDFGDLDRRNINCVGDLDRRNINSVGGLDIHKIKD